MPGWSCGAPQCGHTAPAFPTGLPVLWSGSPPPPGVCPKCSCGGLLRAVVCHASSPLTPWSPHWLCGHHEMSGPALFGPRSVGGPAWALALAAEYLPHEIWQLFMSRRTASGPELWRDLRAQVTARASLPPEAEFLVTALPPWSPLPSDGDSVAVSLLLDVAGLLKPEAAQAWRAHPAYGPPWERTVAQLRGVPAVPRATAVDALAISVTGHGGPFGSPHMERRAWLAWAVHLYAEPDPPPASHAELILEAFSSTGSLISEVRAVLFTSFAAADFMLSGGPPPSPIRPESYGPARPVPYGRSRLPFSPALPPSSTALSSTIA